MPEGLEAEIYRRAAQRALGRPIRSVDVDDHQPLAGALRSALPGSSFVRARRIGKLVLLDTVDAGGEPGPTLGLHFGMTGRLVVDGAAPIAELEYGNGRDDPAWDRLVVVLADGGVLRVNDPRRWARFDLDPDEARLGPDLLAVTDRELGRALRGRRAAVKGVLLDQTAVAGLGNLCVDEVLWQAAVSPLAPAGELGADAVAAISAAMRRHLPAMLARGGSHRGTIDPALRAALPPCPRDGTPLRRDRVAGRTTIWCPGHQVAR